MNLTLSITTVINYTTQLQIKFQEAGAAASIDDLSQMQLIRAVSRVLNNKYGLELETNVNEEYYREWDTKKSQLLLSQLRALEDINNLNLGKPVAPSNLLVP